jgi:hypothetical protein
VLPETVQLPTAEKLTDKRELAVALTVKSGSLKVLSASAPNAIVWIALATVNDRSTEVAALLLLSPACDAVMVQGPAPVMCTVLPLTVQLPAAEKLTDKPELAVALTVKSDSPNFLPVSVPNVMVWFAMATVNDWSTEVAALLLLSPACDAVMVQGPAPVMCTVLPLTVQLPVAEKLTDKPELAVALTVKSGSPKVLPASAANVIVWPAFCAVTDSVTCGAAL